MNIIHSLGAAALAWWVSFCLWFGLSIWVVEITKELPDALEPPNLAVISILPAIGAFLLFL
jgi:hypothetical protein